MSKEVTGATMNTSLVRRPGFALTGEHVSTGFMILTQLLNLFTSSRESARASRENEVLRRVVQKKVRALKAEARKESSATAKRRLERQINSYRSLIED